MQADFATQPKDKTLTVRLEADGGVDNLLLQAFDGCKVQFNYKPETEVLEAVLTLIGAY